nr:MAG TPA: hypothetical protein [Bacteriophage sp.]
MIISKFFLFTIVLFKLFNFCFCNLLLLSILI